MMHLLVDIPANIVPTPNTLRNSIVLGIFFQFLPFDVVLNHFLIVLLGVVY